MSTGTRRPLAVAKKDAEVFREMFAGCFDKWVIAGSIRRNKDECGDCEHVVIPRFEEVPSGMFAEPMRTNLLWEKVDSLLSANVIERHRYHVTHADGTTGTRTMWGDSYRGISWRGSLHEIFVAAPDNFGCILTIRTGPGEFSKEMVSRLHGTLLRQKDGYLRYANGRIYPCATEEKFFEACGMKWLEPEQR